MGRPHPEALAVAIKLSSTEGPMSRKQASLLLVIGVFVGGCASPTVPGDNLGFDATVFLERDDQGEALISELTVINNGSEAVTLVWGGCNAAFILKAYPPGSDEETWTGPRPPSGAVCTLQRSELALQPGERSVIRRRMTIATLRERGLPAGSFRFAIVPTFSQPQIHDLEIRAGIAEIP